MSRLVMLEILSDIDLEIMKVLWGYEKGATPLSIINELENRNIVERGIVTYSEDEVEDRENIIKQKVSSSLGRLISKGFVKVRETDIGFRYDANIQSHIYYCYAITVFAKSLFYDNDSKKDIEYVHKLRKQCEAIEEMYNTIEN